MVLPTLYKNRRIPPSTYTFSRKGKKTVGVLVILLVTLAHFAHGESINVREAIQVGGIQQWISIQGSSEKPILLFIHGGPGNSVMGYADQFTGKLASNFLMVHWDQRESGETLKLNPSPVTLTVSLFVSDGVEVIQHLTKRFHKQKLFLMGHSWGGFLALRLAQEVPELIEACVAMSPMVDQIKSEQLAIEWMKKKATEKGHSMALDELAKIHIPFENSNDLYLHRKWLAVLGNRKAPERAFVETWAHTWLSVFMEGAHMNLTELAPAYRCPVYFFVGRHDYQTNFSVTEGYYQAIQAPSKKIIWFEKSAHSPNMTETKKFQQVTLEALAGNKASPSH